MKESFLNRMRVMELFPLMTMDYGHYMPKPMKWREKRVIADYIQREKIEKAIEKRKRKTKKLRHDACLRDSMYYRVKAESNKNRFFAIAITAGK